MKRLLGVALVSFLVYGFGSRLVAEAAAPANDAKVAPIKIDGGYAVVVSKETAADPKWAEVVAALKQKYAAEVIQYSGDVAAARQPLAHLLPRYACFVARPEEAGRKFVIAVHRLTRRLNSDPYTDVIWGILTGYDAADALAAANIREPLVIRKAAAGTGIPLDKFDAGVWYSESDKGVHFEKAADGKVEKKSGPDDSTQALVELFNTYKPDLFMTSGHASERDWQIGYSYRNGFFRAKDGVLRGIDTNKAQFPIDSQNPKVYLALGNCLMGHIPDRSAMAVAFMHSAGVRQMCGYVVSTWYGYGGWGVRDYFMNQPGRFSLAEAFYANNQALVHELETRFPKGARFDNDQWNIETDQAVIPHIADKLGYKKWDNDVKDHVGLIWDRDTVAFYGDPAWDARLAPRDCAWDQTLTEKDGLYTFQITAKQDAGWNRPPVAILPHRVKNPDIISGTEFKPTIGELFVMVSAPAKFEKGKTYTVVFKSGKDEAATGPGATGSASALREGTTDQLSRPASGGPSAAEIAEKVALLPVNYRPQAIQALAIADTNAGELLKAIAAVPSEHREALAFLLIHMPSDDLEKIKADFLLENIDYAYRARQATAWGKDLPDELFFNDVLPYANVNERRDNWRKDFFEKFSPAIKDCRTPGEAAMALNKAVFEKTGVKYHPTKRPKPDQSPYESIEAHYASCTGLSILLVDACRAVGVPARVVGTQWTNTAGNHTWIEVWDRQWNYLGAAEPSPLNQTWFAGNAKAADGTKPDKRIYAASWLKTGVQWPLVWAPDYKDAAAYDVTPFYTAREPVEIQLLGKAGGQPQKAAISLRLGDALVAAAPSDSSFKFDLARGQKYVAQLTPTDGKPITREFTIPEKGAAEQTLFLTN